MKKLLPASFIALAILGYGSVILILLALMDFVHSLIQIGDPESVGMGLFVIGVVYGPVIIVGLVVFVVLILTSTILLKAGIRITKSVEPALPISRKVKVSAFLCLGLVMIVVYEILPLTIHQLGIK